MDNFINLAKQGLDAYQESQNKSERRSDGNNERREEGQYKDTRHNESPKTPDLDKDDIVNRAQQHSGDSGSSDFFSSAINHVFNRKTEQHESVDEEHVTKVHEEAYSKNNAGNLDSSSLGAAAAMQALKKFTQGSSDKQSGGSSQLISLAMSEAVKLFDKSGKSSSNEKQDVINSAAMTMMKLVVQSKFSGSNTIGGGNSGGLSSILGMAKQFM